jgi:energy-coupling factor transporter ATP-binding protein EcfA2
MKITKLVLINYKRLMLSNIRHFEWTPLSNIILLLGSNGSGKSSVLEEMTPCPAHHDQFEAGGSKEFHCTHNNSSYALVSVYSGRGTGKHSFMRDSEELNPGGTFAVQKELVARILKMDRSIHEVLIGLMPFSAMPTNKRREWLTRLSPVDLTFAFSKFSAIKSFISDARGVVNHNAKRMANENIDLPSDAEMHGYRTQIDELTERLQMLYRVRGNEPAKRSNVIDFTSRLDSLRARTRQHLESQPNSPDLYGVKSKSDIEGRIHVADHTAHSAKQQMEELAQELDDIERQKIPVDDIGTPEAIEELRQEVEVLTARIEERGKASLIDTGPWPLVLHEVFPHSKAMLDEMVHTWTALVTEFPVNHDEYFNHQKGTDARLRFAENKTRIQSLSERHSSATRRLAQLRGCEHVICPDCTHQFVPGQSPEDVKLAEANCLQLGTTIEGLEAEQVTLKDYIEAYDDYLTFINRFRQLVRQYELYKPLWDYAIARRVMFVEPRRELNSIIAWHTAQTAYIEMTEATQRVKVIAEKLERYNTVDRSQADYIRRRQEQVESKIIHIADQQQIHQQEAKRLRQVVGSVETYSRSTELLNAELSHYMKQVNEQIVDLVKLGYDEEIKHTSLKLSDLQASLHRFELREHTLKDIEREHKEAQQWYADMQLLAKAMSPTDGLIGRYLMGFMQNIVKLLNAVIEEIWTYPMEVLPSKVDKDELDYNFPIDVRNGAVMAPDIARGSTSQRDVVNFAFRLIMMKFLGLEDYPLFLDEFASSFDEQHRQNVIPFLMKLIEMGQVSQIIYISHFSATHGAFTNAEAVVLDPTNITTPPVYNRTVKIA